MITFSLHEEFTNFKTQTPKETLSVVAPIKMSPALNVTESIRQTCDKKCRKQHKRKRMKHSKKNAKSGNIHKQ